MTGYNDNAIETLKSIGGEIEITRMGYAFPNWDPSHKHPLYRFTICTKKGRYSGDFYGSRAEAEAEEKLARIKYPRYSPKEIRAAREKLDTCKTGAYDILACLTKWDPGTFSDFCAEYGYSDDSISAFNTYQAVCNEYAGLRKIFTADQLEKLAEIE